ncbi:MAG TPA: EpsI family protein [Opitutus sp.]|nr:EpsI family protein [Opitutus sp.]
MHWAALFAGVMGVALFQFFGNATRGYVDTPSLFWWWISQWIDPGAETEHGWLILGLSGWLFWRNIQQPGSARGGGARFASSGSEAVGAENASCFQRGWAPFGAVLAALGLHGLGFVAQQSRISIIAWLLFSWGILALANRRWGRAAAFPLGFMVFAIPLNVLDLVGFWLRLGVIEASAAIVQLMGLDVVRSGTQLFAPDLRFQYDVAAVCSGVRSLMALTALSLLIGYVSFRSISRRALMLLLCFPLTYIGNVARVTTIVIAAEWGGPNWGALMHDFMGYGIFVIVLGGVLGGAAIVRRVWPEKPERRNDAEIAAPPGPVPGWAPWAWCGAVVLLVVVEMALLAQVSGSSNRGAAGIRLTENGADPIELPAFLGTEWIGRQTEVSAVERAILPADTGFSRRTYVSVANRSHAVFLSIVLSGRDRTSIHRPEICLVGQGWTINRVEQHAFASSDALRKSVPATLLHTTLIDPVSQRQLQALMAYWFVSADAVVASHWQRFTRDAWNRLRHGRVDRWAYVMVQADAVDGDGAALERMQKVLDETMPVFLLPAGPRSER